MLTDIMDYEGNIAASIKRPVPTSIIVGAMGHYNFAWSKQHLLLYGKRKAPLTIYIQDDSSLPDDWFCSLLKNCKPGRALLEDVDVCEQAHAHVPLD